MLKSMNSRLYPFPIQKEEKEKGRSFQQRKYVGSGEDYLSPEELKLLMQEDEECTV